MEQTKCVNCGTVSPISTDICDKCGSVSFIPLKKGDTRKIGEIIDAKKEEERVEKDKIDEVKKEVVKKVKEDSKKEDKKEDKKKDK